jgi:hypothetical protein
MAGQTYKYARIVNVHRGMDGKVRAADVENKVPGESKFRMTTRPIHKLVLIVPVEEQTMEEAEERDSQEYGGGEQEEERQRGSRPPGAEAVFGGVEQPEELHVDDNKISEADKRKDPRKEEEPGSPTLSPPGMPKVMYQEAGGDKGRGKSCKEEEG